MRFLPFLTLVLTAALAAFSLPAFAQDSVQIRSGAHDGYARLVFEWPQATTHSVTKEGGRVLIRFARAGSYDAAAIGADLANIKNVKTISAAGEPLQVAVEIPDGSRFRDFTVGSKMILDVYDAPSAAQATKKEETAPAPAPEKKAEVQEKPTAAAPEEKQQAAPAKEETPAKVPSAEAAPKKQAEDFSVTQGEKGASAPLQDVEASTVAPPSFDPHVITLTSITSVGMSAFVRQGWLWIVTDVPENASAPTLTGPQKDKFSKMEKVDVPGGVAYRMDLPEGLNVYGEGGGLAWRVILTPKSRKTAPATAQAQPGDGAGSLVWPLKNMRKAITFTDPVIGDQITAVTATQADQYAGPGRGYVQLNSLTSAVGLAYVAKADDVNAKITVADVSVGRPGGLSLSRASDARAGEIRQEMAAPEDKEEAAEETPAPEAKEEAAEHAEETPAEKHGEEESKEDLALTDAPPEVPSKEEEEAHAIEKEINHDAVTVTAATKAQIEGIADEKPSGNNIYNFPRWEMGGVQALSQNLHVLMAEIANKPEEERTGDFITMAKMLLANNRGPEALGMLRIALLQVPALEDNKEFRSLRAAALALSGKYDEAIEDFSHETLSPYDDIKFWRAYTLAGLEDWKQAAEILPSDISPIAAYPKELRTPMALAFAEVALRNGNTAMAQGILDVLKPELPKLPLNYASSWNYLAGEAERQSGHAARAEEYWEPLVKNGKDDLFRAKAGLSLTRLQIEQKKLSPAEAINRLEGLRYAWRGDELETLINYRLGQMYIDSGDYLKGLTVLRNATTLTPGLQVGQDVKSYMTKSFRDLFKSNRLDKVSPLEAISIYEEFKDLTPPGEEGNVFVEKLAERLVNADLLGRAASLLEYMVNNRLQGDKKAEIAIRLAAIRLLDGNPDGALRALEVAQATLDKIAAGNVANVAPQAGGDAKAETAAAPVAATAPIPAPTAEKVDPEKQRQIMLLKARALSMKKKPDEAIAVLQSMTLDADVNRLRTDIAWTAGKWDEAAMSLNDLIIAEDISPKRPLTEYQRDIIFNRAIALNLSGNRVALANLRERYNTQMKATGKGQMFEIVTRPRRPDMVGSRQAIESMISEIDLFQGFVDGYSKMDANAKPDAPKEPAAVKEPTPAKADEQKSAPAGQ